MELWFDLLLPSLQVAVSLTTLRATLVMGWYLALKWTIQREAALLPGILVQRLSRREGEV